MQRTRSPEGLTGGYEGALRTKTFDSAPSHAESNAKKEQREEDGRRSSLQTGNSQTYEPAAPSRLNRAEPLRWNGALRLVCNGPPAGGALAAVWLMAALAVVGGLSPVGSRASVRHVSFCRTPSEELRWFLTCCRRSAPGDGRPLRGAGTRGGERPPEGLLVHSWRSCRKQTQHEALWPPRRLMLFPGFVRICR